MNLLMTVENVSPGSVELLTPHHANPDGFRSKGIFFDNLLSVQLNTSYRNTFHSGEDAGEEDKVVLINNGDISTDLPSGMNELIEENRERLSSNQLGLHSVNPTIDSRQGQTDSHEDIVVSSFPMMLNMLSMLGHTLMEMEDGSKQRLKVNDDTSGIVSNEVKCAPANTFKKYFSLKDFQALKEYAFPVLVSTEGQIDNSTPGKDTQIPLDEISLKLLTENELSLPFEAHVQGEQFINKEQNGLANAQGHYPALKDFQAIKINAAPFAPGVDEKPDKMLPGNYRIIIPKGITPVSVNEPQSLLNATSGKSITTKGISFLVEDLAQGEGLIKKEQGKTSSLDKIGIEPKNVFFPIENKNGKEDSSFRLQMVQEPAKVDKTNDNIFVTAKSGDASIKVSLEPDGIGKIDIELVLDRGVINAQINTSETTGKEFIEKNLHTILSSLTNEGLNIGSFSVSLRNKRGETKDDGGKEALQVFRQNVIKTIQLPYALPDTGIVNIFV